MKIEKISDNQIRCCLTKEDLAERQIQLSELAYGSEKARALFRDMMIQANKEYGFTNDANIPLMIEAIPGSGNTLTLVITKVEDPEELDTRFAKFSPTEVVADDAADTPVEGADDIIDVFHKLLEAKAGSLRKKSEKDDTGQKAPSQKKSARGRKKSEPASSQPPLSLTRAFRFSKLDDVIHAADALHHFYKGESSLYHTGQDSAWLLVVHQAQSPEDFNRVCNILSEYGSPEQCSGPVEAHLREHGCTIVVGSAISKLASILKHR